MYLNPNHNFSPAVQKTQGTDLNNLRPPYELHVSLNQKWLKYGLNAATPAFKIA